MLFKDISYVDENFVLQKGSIIVENDTIAWAGECAPACYSGEVFAGADKLAMPGFFNNHCHVPMVLMRGYGEGKPLKSWLADMRPFANALTPDDVYWGSLLGIAEMIKSGIVGFKDMYRFTGGIVRAVDQSGIKASISYGAMAVEGDSFYDNIAYAETEKLLDYQRSAHHDRIRVDAALHAEYTSSPRLIKELVEYAAKNSLAMHVHVSETVQEHEECKARHNGQTSVQYLNAFGLFDLPATAAHCVHIESDDFAILRDKNVTVSHCPSSNLKLGSGIAKIWEMHKKGISVAISTDGAASNNNLNGLEEVNLATLVQRGANRDPLCMDNQTVLAMAALNGAKAQGRKNCGRIMAGNRADIVIYDMAKPHLQPVFDGIANVLFSAQASDICMTMVDGNVLYQDGLLKTIDEERVMFECNRIAAAIGRRE